MWSFAIWDSQKKELFLSRDIFLEKKPLFYYETKKEFILVQKLNLYKVFHKKN